MVEQRARIVAVGLLTETDLKRLGSQFDRWYPVSEAPCFTELVAAIDDADRAFQRERDENLTNEIALRTGA